MLRLLIPMVLLASCVASWWIPEVAALDRHALAGGELWRLWTGHLVHWSHAHLLWDGLTFVVLAWLLARLAPRALAWLVGLGSPLVAAAVLLMQPELQLYGGLSGLDVALWVAVCLTVALRSRDRGTSVCAWLALAGGLVKVGFELATGNAVLVAGVTLVPAAHLAGVLVGLGAVVGEFLRPPLPLRVARGPREEGCGSQLAAASRAPTRGVASFEVIGEDSCRQHVERTIHHGQGA